MPKTYLITGTSRGLGLEFVRQLARRGDRVIACSRSREAAKESAEFAARFIELDAADERSIQAAAAELRNEPIDVLINNAGVYSEDKTIDAASFVEFDRVLVTNVAGPAFLTKVLLTNLRAGRGRTIVNISSGLGSLQTVEPSTGIAYCASKAALNMVTVRASQDLAREGFTVVTFSPGWVRTDMGGPQAPLSPEESVRGMLEVIDRLTTADNGKFLNYDGSTLPW